MISFDFFDFFAHPDNKNHIKKHLATFGRMILRRRCFCLKLEAVKKMMP